MSILLQRTQTSDVFDRKCNEERNDITSIKGHFSEAPKTTTMGAVDMEEAKLTNQLSTVSITPESERVTEKTKTHDQEEAGGEESTFDKENNQDNNALFHQDSSREEEKNQERDETLPTETEKRASDDKKDGEITSDRKMGKIKTETEEATKQECSTDKETEEKENEDGIAGLEKELAELTVTDTARSVDQEIKRKAQETKRKAQENEEESNAESEEEKGKEEITDPSYPPSFKAKGPTQPNVPRMNPPCNSNNGFQLDYPLDEKYEVKCLPCSPKLGRKRERQGHDYEQPHYGFARLNPPEPAENTVLNWPDEIESGCPDEMEPGWLAENGVPGCPVEAEVDFFADFLPQDFQPHNFPDFMSDCNEPFSDNTSNSPEASSQNFSTPDLGDLQNFIDPTAQHFTATTSGSQNFPAVSASPQHFTVASSGYQNLTAASPGSQQHTMVASPGYQHYTGASPGSQNTMVASPGYQHCTVASPDSQQHTMVASPGSQSTMVASPGSHHFAVVQAGSQNYTVASPHSQNLTAVSPGSHHYTSTSPRSQNTMVASPASSQNWTATSPRSQNTMVASPNGSQNFTATSPGSQNTAASPADSQISPGSSYSPYASPSQGASYPSSSPYHSSSTAFTTESNPPSVDSIQSSSSGYATSSPRTQQFLDGGGSSPDNSASQFPFEEEDMNDLQDIVSREQAIDKIARELKSSGEQYESPVTIDDILTPPTVTQAQLTQHQLTQHQPTQHQVTKHQLAQHQPTQHQVTKHQLAQHQPTQHQPTQHQVTQHQPTQHQLAQHQPTQHQLTQPIQHSHQTQPLQNQAPIQPAQGNQQVRSSPQADQANIPPPMPTHHRPPLRTSAPSTAPIGYGGMQMTNSGQGQGQVAQAGKPPQQQLQPQQQQQQPGLMRSFPRAVVAPQCQQGVGQGVTQTYPPKTSILWKALAAAPTSSTRLTGPIAGVPVTVAKTNDVPPYRKIAPAPPKQHLPNTSKAVHSVPRPPPPSGRSGPPPPPSTQSTPAVRPKQHYYPPPPPPPTQKRELAKANMTIAMMNPHALLHIDGDGDSQLHMYAVNKEYGQHAIALIHRLKREENLHFILNHKNQLDQTPLYLAVLEGSDDLVHILINHGADVNAPAKVTQTHFSPPDIRTPLQAAARMGSQFLNKVKMLLDAPEINVDAKNYKGETALLMAIEQHGRERGPGNLIDSTKTIQMLLKYGASLTVGDLSNGKTPLHHIVEKRDCVLLETVLKEAVLKEARALNQKELWPNIINAQTFDLNTPLHLAAGLNMSNEEDHVKLVRLLLSHGADATKKNQNNAAPKDNVKQKRQKVIDVLRGHNQRSSKPSQQCLVNQ